MPPKLFAEDPRVKRAGVIWLRSAKKPDEHRVPNTGPDPLEVILSYIKKNPEPDLEDLGFVQQSEIFNLVRAKTNSIPPVIDARDVLENPERILRLLCDAIGVPFEEKMLGYCMARLLRGVGSEE